MSIIDINKKGRRIEVRATVPLPGFRTTIPGAYESVNGHWTVPLSLETCKLLREKYGKRLRVGSELSRWAKGVRDNRAYMARLAASKTATLDVLPDAAPKLYKAMGDREYQRAGVRFVADNHATLVADEPGLGKTLIAMGGIIEAQIPGPYLIIASPKTAVRSVWTREIKRWLPNEHKAVILPEIRVYRERKLRYTHFDKFTWLVVHPEIAMTQTWYVCQKCGKHSKQMNKRKRVLSCGHIKTPKTKRIDKHSYPHLFKLEWGAIVIDESHESLIRRSGVPTQRRNGLDQLKLRADGIKIAMSGSPDGSHPHQLWGTLNWLDPKTYSAFYRWAELYWQKGGYTGFQIGEFREDREHLLWDSLASVAIRRTKAEVAKDLPPKMHVGTLLDPSDEDSPIGIWLPMEGDQARAYSTMLEQSVAELDSGRLEAITALAELTRLKQLACSYGDIHKRKIMVDGELEYRYKYLPKLPSNKFNWLVENLEEWGFPSSPLTKVAIVSFYTGLLEMFSRELERFFKTKPNRPLTTMITGRVSDRNRDLAIQRFNQRDNEQIMLINVKAGGTAITIDSADRMVFLSETRLPHQQTQAEDRIHRVSNPRQCMYYYLRSLDTVDVGTAIYNQELARGSRRLLDVRRGVEYTRHIIDLSS